MTCRDLMFCYFSQLYSLTPGDQHISQQPWRIHRLSWVHQDLVFFQQWIPNTFESGLVLTNSPSACYQANKFLESQVTCQFPQELSAPLFWLSVGLTVSSSCTSNLRLAHRELHGSSGLGFAGEWGCLVIRILGLEAVTELCIGPELSVVLFGALTALKHL